MTDDQKNKDEDPLAEVQAIRDEFEAQMHGLKRKQRTAVEKALKAVDKKKIEKIHKTLDGLQ